MIMSTGKCSYLFWDNWAQNVSSMTVPLLKKQAPLRNGMTQLSLQWFTESPKINHTHVPKPFQKNKKLLYRNRMFNKHIWVSGDILAASAEWVYLWYLKHNPFFLLVFFRLQDWPMLYTGQQPDVPGSAEWYCVHQDTVLCHHWPSLGSSVWDVPCPATPLPPRVHSQHPQWRLPRSEVIHWWELFIHTGQGLNVLSLQNVSILWLHDNGWMGNFVCCWYLKYTLRKKL